MAAGNARAGGGLPGYDFNREAKLLRCCLLLPPPASSCLLLPPSPCHRLPAACRHLSCACACRCSHTPCGASAQSSRRRGGGRECGAGTYLTFSYFYDVLPEFLSAQIADEPTVAEIRAATLKVRPRPSSLPLLLSSSPPPLFPTSPPLLPPFLLPFPSPPLLPVPPPRLLCSCLRPLLD